MFSLRITSPMMTCVVLCPQDETTAGDSIRELLSLSKKLAAFRVPPRVVGVQGMTRSGVSSDPVDRDTFVDPKAGSREAASSASVAWQKQQVLNARLEREWKEGRGRAANTLTTLLGGGESGRVNGTYRIATPEMWIDSFFCSVRCSRN